MVLLLECAKCRFKDKYNTQVQLYTSTSDTLCRCHITTPAYSSLSGTALYDTYVASQGNLNVYVFIGIVHILTLFQNNCHINKEYIL